jgi:glycosyltransferase involved in cell wall biosynthesis
MNNTMPTVNDNMPRVSAIISAYNEAGRIEAVLSVVMGSGLFNEVIVVDDGSSDGTADVARDAGATVVCHERNRGKARAMLTGLDNTTGECVAFLDADLLNVTTQHLADLVNPVVRGDVQATLGVFRGGRTSTTLGQRISPTMSGQRCLRRELLSGFDGWGRGFGIETAINAHLRRSGIELTVVEWRGAAQVMKEEKRGVLLGFMARLAMFFEVFVAWMAVGWRRG